MNVKKAQILIIYGSEKEAVKIDNYLLSFGFSSIFATPYYQLGVKYASEKNIDIIIINSKIKKYATIKRLTEKKSLQGVPVIFYTENNQEYEENVDSLHLRENKHVAFLFNPCNDRSLFVTIGLLYKLRKSAHTIDSLFLKNSKKQIEKVTLSDILFVEAGVTSCRVYTRWDVFLMSGSMPKLAKKFSNRFIKVHDKYMINQQQISHISKEHIAFENYNVPIAKSFIEEVQKKIYNLNKGDF